MNLFSGRSTSRMPAVLITIALVLIIVGGMFILRYITPQGMGLVNDSIAYIGGARNILAGNGYSRLTGDGTPAPITNYPPMVSILLAAVGLTGLGILPAAGLVNIVLFGFNILLIFQIGRKTTGKAGCGLLAGLFFAVCGPILSAHSFVMSEPLYLFLTMLVILVNLQVMKKGGNWNLLLAGFLSGIAFLTRYVGISLFAMTLFGIWVAGRSQGYRLQKMFIYLLAATPPVLAWLIRNMRIADSVVNRQIIWHPIPPGNIREGLLNFWGWLLPEWGGLIEQSLPILGVLLGLLFFFIAIYIVLGSFRLIKGGLKATLEPTLGGWLVAVLALSYLAVLVLSLVLVDASPIFEHRILSPLYVCLLLLGVHLISWISGWKRIGRICSILMTVFILFSFLEDSLDLVHDLQRDGQGFASSEWRESETLHGLEEFNGVLLYSNKPTAIYILLDRPAYYLPSPINPATHQPRENYREDLEAIKTQVLNGRAAMVIFGYRDLLAVPEEKPWVEELIHGLPVAREYEDGVILGLTPKFN